MGRVIANFYMSLDGVVEAPERWQFPYFNEQMQAAMASSTGASAFLMGRKLYELWSAYWPTVERVEPGLARDSASIFAEFINRVPKYVVSHTLEEADWPGTTVLRGGLEDVRELRERVDGDIAMAGSATLVRALLAEGLVDELRLLLHPLVVGQGDRLFEDGAPHTLRLIDHEAFDTGVLSLAFAPA